MLPRLRIPLLLALALMAAGPVAADDAYDRCMSATDGTNPAFAACGADWIAREDGKLNAAWKRVFPLFEGAGKAALLAEQRAWNAFKEASCGFYASGAFGREGEVVQSPICRADVIAARTKQLQEYGKFAQRQ